MREAQLIQMQKYYKGTLLSGSNKIIEQTASEITEYFEGKRQQFSVQLDLQGSEFQRRVWKQLLDIPYGKTRSYKEQAIAIGNLKAIDRKSTRLNSSHVAISYAVFCLKKKKHKDLHY